MKRRKAQNETPLMANDFFRANDPEFLKRNPDIKRRLIESERKNMPEECLCCIFLGHNRIQQGYEFFCALGDFTLEYGKRAKECILEKGEEE